MTPGGDGWLDYESGEDGGDDGAGGTVRTHVLRLGRDAPYLAQVIFRSGGTVYYEAIWEGTSDTRVLSRRIDDALDPDGEADFSDLELVFDRPVNLQGISFGGTEIAMVAIGAGERFSGIIDAPAMRALLDAGEDIRIRVPGR